jgi:hypothetical protein
MSWPTFTRRRLAEPRGSVWDMIGPPSLPDLLLHETKKHTTGRRFRFYSRGDTGFKEKESGLACAIDAFRIRRTKASYVAGKCVMSQQVIFSEKAQDECRSMDAEYGFHSSHGIAICRRNFLASYQGCHSPVRRVRPVARAGDRATTGGREIVGQATR